MELKLQLAQRISRNERAAARKRRIDGLSINAHRNCVTGYCPYCTGNRTFSRNVPASVAIEEQLDTPVLPEPSPWTYYDTAATFYEDDAIDLADLLREQFYLALPMKPLCRQDCKGLCPQCGTNLNTDTCQCQVRWEDPRLAGLKALIPDRKHDDA